MRGLGIGLGLGLARKTGVGGLPPPLYTFDFTTLSALPPNMSFARAGGGATYFDAGGNLQSASANTPRFNCDQVSGAQNGLLVEGARTNAIRNNTMIGGDAGVLPTDWSFDANGSGLTATVIGTGTQKGVNYVDVRLSGTTISANAALLYFDVTNQIASSNGQAWINSAFLNIVSGDNTNITNISLDLEERDSGNVLIATLAGLNIYSNILPSARPFRPSNVLTVNQASTAFVAPRLTVTPGGSGVAIDITIRIGMPQLELRTQGGVSSVIPTSGSSVSRAADSPQLTGVPATSLQGTQYSSTAEINASSNGNSSGIAANGVVRAGLGTQSGGGFFAISYDNVHALLQNTIISATGFFLGLAISSTTRWLTNLGGSIYGGSVSSDANPLKIGPYVGTDQGFGTALFGNLARLKIWAFTLNASQLQSVTYPASATACWGDSLPNGTGSVAPSINYGYVGYLGASLGQGYVFNFGIGGQTSTQIAARMISDTYHTNDNVVLEGGRNNIASQSTILSDFAAMVAHLGSNQRFVVLSIINSTAENSAASGASLTAYNQILAINAALAAAYPNNYLDVRSAIVSASGGANDAPPASWMYQSSVHPNDAGYQVMAAQIKTFGHNAGWVGY